MYLSWGFEYAPVFRQPERARALPQKYGIPIVGQKEQERIRDEMRRRASVKSARRLAGERDKG